MMKICLVFFFLGSLLAEDDRGITKYAGSKVVLLFEDEDKHVSLKSGLDVTILTENLDPAYKGKILRSFVVPKKDAEEFDQYVTQTKPRMEPLLPDLGKFIEEEKAAESTKKWLPGDRVESKIYLPYKEMKDYLTYIDKIKNPERDETLAKLDFIGTTDEGRDLFLVKLSSEHSKNKPIIFFEAGINGRDWPAVATARYLISQLVEYYSDNKRLLRDIDVYIIPVSNPDGYEYSRTVDRLWVKNRSEYDGKRGVNINRNFGYNYWNISSSENPLSDNYRGPSPFSEKEVRHIRDVAMQYRTRLKAFVSIQTDNGVLTYPWSTSFAPACQLDYTKYVAKRAVEEIQKLSGDVYKTGQGWELLYDAGGRIDDYFKGTFEVDLAYTLKIAANKTAPWIPGFLIPPKDIVAMVKAAYGGLSRILDYAAHPPANFKFRTIEGSEEPTFDLSGLQPSIPFGRFRKEC